MRELMISIKPKWCELICSGEKTVEVRKNRPNCELPFKCYIYETKDKRFEDMGYCWSKGKYFEHHIGKVIGEFVCDKIYDITPHFDTPTFPNQYICGWDYGKEFDCLSFEELTSYLKGKKGYGWHITDLLVYDEPRELGEFYNLCDGYCFDSAKKQKCASFNPDNPYSCNNMKPLKRPPQSWCYIEPRQTAD